MSRKFSLVKETLEIFLTSMAIGIILISFHYIFFSGNEQEKEFSSQIETLDSISDNLSTLQKFISDQKKTLIESEKTIRKLREEENTIKPVIEADRKTIEAIFQLQTKISARNSWFERGIAFVLGVFSSMLATMIIGFIKRKTRATS